MCLWCTSLPEHEVINKITFSALRAVHYLTLHDPSLYIFAASNDFTYPNSYSEIFHLLLCSMLFEQIKNIDQNTSFFIERYVCKHSSDVRKYVLSAMLENCKLK